MELSSAQNSDIIKLNRFTMYAHGTNNENFQNIEIIKKNKTTPRKCKSSSNVQEAQMKKSSSLHNIELINNFNHDGKDVISTSAMNMVRGVSSDKQQIFLNSELLSRIEKEKKTYEATISELILNGETRKKEKEMLLLENKRLTETVQNLQMDFGKLRNVSCGLRSKIRELGFEVEDEMEMTASDVMDASGDGGTGRSCPSLTLATVGDTNSVLSDEWPLADDTPGPDREFLNSLSVSTLQERIQKMEEHSYCTEEELQATMQELRDLQHSLDSLNDDNRTLTFERAILLESLCEQTENLQRCRQLSDHLKFMLLSHNLSDFPKLDANLRELYTMSEREHVALTNQNEEFKQTIMSCQSESRLLAAEVDSLGHKLSSERAKYSQLEEKYRDELWQREQVESVLRSHSELFGQTVGWTDCSSGVLALIQQSKGQKQTEASLRAELSEKAGIVEKLLVKTQHLEEGMRQGMRHKLEHKGSIEQLQSQLKASEHEISVLAQTLDIIRQKNADDVISWRAFERDLLTAITAANSLKEDRDKDVCEFEQRLALSEQQRKQLMDQLDSQKSVLASQRSKERVMVARDQSSLASTNNSVKTLIQSLEYQMKPGTVVMKQRDVVTIPSHGNGTSTVPRSSINTKTTKSEMTRTNTVTVDCSPSKHKPETSTMQKSSSFKKEHVHKQASTGTESNQTLLQPLTTVVSQASSILQSVSRRNSVVTTEHHNHYQSSPVASKPESPAPTITTDPLAQLVKTTNKGSKRNALLYWCQSRTNGYAKIDITNFSSSWNDGLALCALLHSFDPSLVDFKKLADDTPTNPDKTHKRINFHNAFSAADKLGIANTLDIETMINVERPTWNSVMNYVVEIYTHFESQQNDWAPPLHK